MVWTDSGSSEDSFSVFALADEAVRMGVCPDCGARLVRFDNPRESGVRCPLCGWALLFWGVMLKAGRLWLVQHFRVSD